MNDFKSNLIEKLNSLGAEEILRSETDGAYFHALSPLSLNLIEWYPFRREDRVLQIGAAMGVYCPLAERVACWDIYDADGAELDLVKTRLEKKAYVQQPEGSWQQKVHLLSAMPGKTEKSASSGRHSPEAQDPESGQAHYTHLFIAVWPGLEKARQILEESGCREVLALAENGQALKYITGNQKEETTVYAGAEEMRLFCGQAEKTVSDGNRPEEGPEERTAGVSGRLFYPLPLKTVVKELFSDRMLPGCGDFRGIGAGYQEGEASVCDLEALYAALSEKDPHSFCLFAPAFLCCISSRDLPDYIRYNRSRRKKYQTRTEVWKGRRVVKTALTPEADAHIRALEAHAEQLRKEVPDRVSVAQPALSVNAAGRMQATFAFLKGKSLGKLLAAEVRNGRIATEKIEAALETILGKEHTAAAAATAEAEQGGKALHNLDALFENIMVSDDGELTLIDYEWTMEEPYSSAFLRYRILRYFYEENRQLLSAYAGLPGFLESFGFTKEATDAFEKREDAFQSLVYGDGGEELEKRYRKETTGAGEIRELARRMAADEIEELKTTLKKERETERLSQQHIRNIEAINRAREAELAKLRAEAAYLSAHQSAFSRLKQGFIRRLDLFAPADSAKRIAIKHAKGAIRHPFVYIKYISTADGRNYLRGSFAVRGEFLEGGVLTLPEVTNERPPLVSIVIPAYNQVQFTYACIRSILAHTDAASTPYEVILADDASSDATQVLGSWVKNLVVSRTGGNQGFLKNCNQAAGKARGQYLFFLNNDTKVTDGWLSTLLSLMERDPEIGLCGSKLVYPDGRLQEAGGIIWSDGSGWNYGRRDDPEKCQYNYVKEVDYISGAAILIRKPLWEEIGGFDERYAPAYNEDSDLAFAVRKAGKKVVYQPRSVVIHFEGISNGTDVHGSGLKHYQLENKEKFREKWAEELKQQSENTGDPNPFAARERSQKKKTILVIDHYVPHWDKDAGSRTTCQYVQMFLEKGYNVKFLGDNFEAEQPYTGALEQLGVEVLYGEEMREGIFDWIEKNQAFIDIAYLNRPHITVKYLDFLRDHTDIRCIYYGHDLHYMRLHREYELTGNIRKRRESEYWKGLEYQVMERSEMVYYPSQDEIDEIHKSHPEIPARAIVAYIYDTVQDGGQRSVSAEEQKEKAARQVAGSSGFLFVGGFAHQPNEDGVLWFAESIWPLIRRSLPEAEFFIAGSHPTEKVQALDGKEGIHVLGFVSDERLKELYQTCRVVVVPLRYGAGVKGKVIEALSEDAAVLTTSVGAEGIPEAETVMEIIDTPSGFAQKAISLYQDENRLAEMKAADAPFIAKHYSTEAAWSVIAGDF